MQTGRACARCLLLTLLTLLSLLTNGSQAENNVLRFQQYTGSFPQQVSFKPADPSRGYVKNCAPNPVPAFYNISWYPKDINPNLPVCVESNFVSPTDIDVGRFKVTVYYMDTPLVTFDQEYKCSDLADYLRTIKADINVKCPITKGQLFQGSYTFSDTWNLKKYSGDYDIKAELWDVQGNFQLCLQVTATVLPTV